MKKALLQHRQFAQYRFFFNEWNSSEQLYWNKIKIEQVKKFGYLILGV